MHLQAPVTSHGSDLLRCQRRIAHVGYCVAVGTERHQVRHRIDGMLLANGSKRISMVDVDESLGNRAVGCSEVGSARGTLRSVVADAGGSEKRISLVGGQFQIAPSTFIARRGSRLGEQVRLDFRRHLAKQADRGWVGVVARDGNRGQSFTVEVIEPAVLCNWMVPCFTSLTGEDIHLGRPVSPRRAVNPDALDVLPVGPSDSVACTPQLSRRRDQDRIDRDVDGLVTLLSALSAFDQDWALLCHSHQHSGHLVRSAFRRAA